MAIKQISAVALQERLANDEMLFLLDVREMDEFNYAHIKEGAIKSAGNL